jgi:dipeptidyl-peptidase-3
MYNATVGKWGQAHSQARYVITRVLLEASKELVNIEYIEKSPTDGKPDLLIRLSSDPQLIHSVGRKAIGDFLLKLQVYKSLGDIESAQRMYDAYSEVSDRLEHPFLKYRDIVLQRKKPRRLFIESATELVDGKVVLKSFAATHEGLIESFGSHLKDKDVDIDDIVLELWRKDYKHFY